MIDSSDKSESEMQKSFMVMPRYGIDLHKLFMLRKCKFTPEQIYSLGIQLVNALE